MYHPSTSLLPIALLCSLTACSSAGPAAGERPVPTAGTLSPQERCEAIKESVRDAGFADQVQLSCDSDYAYVSSSTYPDHELMNGITGSNEQIPVPAPGYRAPIRLNPASSEKLTTIDAAVGVAVNGVPIYDYSSQGELDPYHYDPQHDTVRLGQLDNCGGHAGRGDDYHYHATPTCMIEAMANRDDNPIIGWAYDGYPIYGDSNPDGSPIAEGSLDVCSGQPDPVYGYRYHTSDDAPYIIQCLQQLVGAQTRVRVNGQTLAFDRVSVSGPGDSGDMEIVLLARHAFPQVEKLSLQFPASLGSVHLSVVQPRYQLVPPGKVADLSL